MDFSVKGDAVPIRQELLDRLKASEPWKLLQFEQGEFLPDHSMELAHLLEIPNRECREIIDSVLSWYHYHECARPPGDRSVQSVVIHLTQPFRIPQMSLRLGPALQLLREHGSIENVLDYGGGGGKDSIIYARAGFQVTYSDFIEPLTDFVRRRFALRGLDIGVMDVRNLKDERFSAVNNMDVLEHIYDFEFSLADIISRLREGGILICEPAFFNDWSGDHKSKNCGYARWFDRIMRDVGLVRMPSGVRAYKKERQEQGGVREERTALRRQLYGLSREYAKWAACKACVKLPFRTIRRWLFIRDALKKQKRRESALSEIIDNLDIYRLSHHRLTFQAEELSGGEPTRT